MTEQYINEGLNRVRYEYDERGLESKRSTAISVIGVTTPEDQKWVDTHIRFDRRGNLMLSEVQSPNDDISLAQKTAINSGLQGNPRSFGLTVSIVLVKPAGIELASDRSFSC